MTWRSPMTEARHAVDYAARDAEGPESGAGVGESRMGFETDDAQRDGAADSDLHDGGGRRREGHGVAEGARNHDVAWAKRLRVGERQRAGLFEIIAQAPFAIYPDAVSVRKTRDSWRERAIGGPVMVVFHGEAEAERQLQREAEGEPSRTEARRQQAPPARRWAAGSARIRRRRRRPRRRRRWRSTRAGTAYCGRAGRARRGLRRRGEDGENDEAEVDREGGGAAELVPSAWKS